MAIPFIGLLLSVGLRHFVVNLTSLELDYTKIDAALFAAFCAVVVWCYQSASARLGAVDLFASEISTTCRVIAVTQTASHLVQFYDNPPAKSIKLNAPYEHSPIFDNNNTQLEVIDPQSIGAVTEFYIYMKSMCDYRHMLDEIEFPDQDHERWKTLVRNVTYMLFLMLESGRKAIGILVENSAVEAQFTAEILLSELVSYRKLFDIYQEAAKEGSDHDARWNRLRLRLAYYKTIVPQICKQIECSKDETNTDSAWNKAEALVPELNQYYSDVLKVAHCGTHPSNE